MTAAVESTTDSGSHAGMVAVVGRANVGKSSLVNTLLGEKLSIVSGVAQTTRNMVRGVLTEGHCQVVFLDTPGVHKAQHDLGRLMNRSARGSIDAVDLVMLVLDVSSRQRDEDRGWMKRLLKASHQCVVVLNKSDLGRHYEADYRATWDDLASSFESAPPAVWMGTSTVDGTGVAELRDLFLSSMPPSPLLFPEDMLSDYPLKWAISDVVREKLFGVLRDELPHAIAVKVGAFDDEAAKWDIPAEVLVNRQSQKGIVIGQKGRLLRKIGRQSEAELANIYEREVRLRLRVKVEKDWAKNHWILKELGYVEK